MRDTPGVAKHEKAADGIGVAGDVRTLWSSIGPARARRALVGMALVVALVVCITIVGQVRLNEWQGAFFDEIEQRNRAGFFRELAVFGAIVAVLLVLVVSQTWLNERMKVLLREAITSDLLDAWLRPARAYELTFAGDIGEHPDQRIHEDARHLSELTIDLGIGLVQTTLLFASFIGVLWGLSAGMTLPFGDRLVTVPGYMVWCALAYATIGSWLTWRLGRPLIHLNADRYAREAEFRFQLVRISENVTSLALHRGEQDERRVADTALAATIGVSRQLADALARLTWVTSAYGWGTLVVPVIAAAPAYFAGSLSLGGLMMAIGAFNQLQQALRWFVDNFPRIADWRATLRRVETIRLTLSELERFGRTWAGDRTGGRLRLMPHCRGTRVGTAQRTCRPRGYANRHQARRACLDPGRRWRRQEHILPGLGWPVASRHWPHPDAAA